MKVHDVFDDGKSVYFVMDRKQQDLLDGLMAERNFDLESRG